MQDAPSQPDKYNFSCIWRPWREVLRGVNRWFSNKASRSATKIVALQLHAEKRDMIYEQRMQIKLKMNGSVSTVHDKKAILKKHVCAYKCRPMCVCLPVASAKSWGRTFGPMCGHVRFHHNGAHWQRPVGLRPAGCSSVSLQLA